MDLNIKKRLNDDTYNIIFPEQIFRDFAEEINKEADPYVQAYVQEYGGPISSYISSPITSAVRSVSLSTKHNIQDDLGSIGGSNYSKFEFLIMSKYLKNFCFRLFIAGYEIGGYPCKIVLEEGFADEINKSSANLRREINEEYIYKLNSSEELNSLLLSIFQSEKFILLIKQICLASNRIQE